MKIYLAGSCAIEQRTILTKAASWLRKKGHEVYCPFELKIPNAWDMSQEDWAAEVFAQDINAMMHSEIMIAISLGQISSAGTNWEIGYATGIDLPVHVIQITDNPTSLMVYCGCTSFVNCILDGDNLYKELSRICKKSTTKSHPECKTILT